MPSKEGIFNDLQLGLQLSFIVINIFTVAFFRKFLERKIGLNTMKGINCIAITYLVLLTLRSIQLLTTMILADSGTENSEWF